jgi:hypothetical protein
MVVLYVDDGGDDSDGLTWAKAYNSITNAAVLAAAAGSTIYVGSDHQETTGAANLFISFSAGTIVNPIKVISADRTSGEPPSTFEDMHTGGGYLQTTGGTYDLIFEGNVLVYGVKLDAGDTTILGDHGEKLVFDDCYIKSFRDIRPEGYESMTEFLNCSFDLSSSAEIYPSDSDLKILIKNCIFVSSAITSIFYFGSLASLECIIEDTDLSTEATFCDTVDNNNLQIILRRCKLASSFVKPTGYDHPHTFFLMESCIEGTDTDPIIGMQYYVDMFGTIEVETTEYRTGGASDGTTSYSWKLISDSTNCREFFNYLKTPPMFRWVEAGSQEIRVYVAGETQLQNDEFYIEVSSPNESIPASSLGNFQTNLPTDILATPANLSSEGSDKWQSTPTYYQYASVSINPTEAGPVEVRACLAKNGTAVTCYIDPKIDSV